MNGDTAALNIGTKLQSVFRDFGIKPSCVVSDQGSKLKQALQESSYTVCVAHNLNLCVNDLTSWVDEWRSRTFMVQFVCLCVGR